MIYKATLEYTEQTIISAQSHIQSSKPWYRVHKDAF